VIQQWKHYFFIKNSKILRSGRFSRWLLMVPGFSLHVAEAVARPHIGRYV
jgi:hypothetical protein